MSGVGKPGDPLDPTGQPSDKTFKMPTGWKSKAHRLRHLKYNLRAPVKDMHMVSDAKLAFLISIGNFADDKRQHTEDR